jgi:hypothetical protein
MAFPKVGSPLHLVTLAVTLGRHSPDPMPHAPRQVVQAEGDLYFAGGFAHFRPPLKGLNTSVYRFGYDIDFLARLAPVLYGRGHSSGRLYGVEKVRVIGWGNHDNCWGNFSVPLGERCSPRVVFPLGRGVAGYPKSDAQRGFFAQNLGVYSPCYIRPRRLPNCRGGHLFYRKQKRAS